MIHHNPKTKLNICLLDNSDNLTVKSPLKQHVLAAKKLEWKWLEFDFVVSQNFQEVCLDLLFDDLLKMSKSLVVSNKIEF